MNHLSQTFCLLASHDFICFTTFNFIFRYYIYCIAITFIITPAVIYIILFPDGSSRLLIQFNCTLISMSIFPPPPLTPKRFSYESFHRKNFFPSHSTRRILIPCVAFSERDCLNTWNSLFFFFVYEKIFTYEKKMLIKLSTYSIVSHYLSREKVVFWITIVLLFFNIK